MEPISEELAATDEMFEVNYPEGLRTWPIPFFGDFRNAEVLTVGVNPSAGEFEPGRWDGIRDWSAAEQRLNNYFENEVIRHDWFETWELALKEIRVSYQGGAPNRLAAHVDLSPRATRSMAAVPDKARFLQMVESDLSLFARLIGQNAKIRLLLLAGTVTNEYYMHDFLAEKLPSFGMRLDRGKEIHAGRGEGKVAFCMLTAAGRNLPVFFCSVSPSAGRRRHKLIERVREHAPAIEQHGNLMGTGR